MWLLFHIKSLLGLKNTVQMVKVDFLGLKGVFSPFKAGFLGLRNRFSLFEIGLLGLKGGFSLFKVRLLGLGRSLSLVGAFFCLYFDETTLFLVILRFIATFVKIEIKEERSIL